MSKCQEQLEKGVAGGQAIKQAEQGNTKEQKEQDHAEVCLLCPHWTVFRVSAVRAHGNGAV